jgi:hypothetical protein
MASGRDEAKGAEGWPGNFNLAVGGFKGAIQENGDPRDDGEKRTATRRLRRGEGYGNGDGQMLHRQESQ